MDNSELLNKLLVIWHLDSTSDKIPLFVDDNESDVISKIIHYRTKSFNVKIPLELGYIISVCSNGNPGMAIIIYYTLLKSIVNRKGKIPRDGYIITSIDFSMSFPNSFPDMSIPSQCEKFEKLWDEQKDENGHNKVDTIEYWNRLFE